MTSWQVIFLQSRVNNGAYDGDYLPAQNWDWPRRTWFQERLYYLRAGRRHRTENHSQAQEMELRSTAAISVKMLMQKHELSCVEVSDLLDLCPNGARPNGAS